MKYYKAGQTKARQQFFKSRTQLKLFGNINKYANLDGRVQKHEASGE